MKPMICIVIPLGAAPGYPDQGLPQPPGTGIWPSPGHPAHPIAPGGQPGHPDQGLPPGAGHPSHPIALPPMPVHPEHPIAGVGGTPEHPIYTPPAPGVPSHPIYIPGTPTHPIALPPGTVWPPLPPNAGEGPGVVVVLAWVPSVGYRWVVVDTSQQPDQGLPQPPPGPDQGLPQPQPPSAQPRRR